MKCHLAIEPLSRLHAAGLQTNCWRHEEKVELRLLGCDLGTHRVDILEQGHVALDERWLRRRIDLLQVGYGSVGSFLATANEIDLGRSCMSGQRQSCRLPNARCAANFEEGGS